MEWDRCLDSIIRATDKRRYDCALKIYQPSMPSIWTDSSRFCSHFYGISQYDNRKAIVRAHEADTESKEHVQLLKLFNLSLPCQLKYKSVLVNVTFKDNIFILNECDEGGECMAVTDNTSQIFTVKTKDTFCL